MDRVLLALSLVVAVGCTGEEAPEPLGVLPSFDESSLEATTMTCEGERFADVAVEEPVPATELPGEYLQVVTAGGVGSDGPPIGDPARWLVADATEERILLLQPLADPFTPGGVGSGTHAVVEVSRVDDGWSQTLGSSCTPRVDVPDDMHAADVWLRSTPAPDAEEVELLLNERECVSGESTPERVVVLTSYLTPGTVNVALAFEDYEVVGGVDCPGNFPIPYTIELPEPIGTRTVVNVAPLGYGRMPTEPPNLGT